MISISARIAQLANLHVAYINRDILSDSQIIRHFQANVMLEFIFYSAGALGSNIFLVGVVSAIAGVELYPDLTIGERKISPPKILSLIRLTISLLALSISISWATAGVSEGIYWYVIFRRFNYLLSVFVIIFITFPVIIFFGSKVVRFLERSIAVLDQKRTVFTEGPSMPDTHADKQLESGDFTAVSRRDKLCRFKTRFLYENDDRIGDDDTPSLLKMNQTTYLLDICDYRMNYFGCTPEQIHYFALSDLILIIFHSCSGLAFISIFVYSIYKARKSKFTMGAKDKICIVAFLAVAFRLAQLSNARKAAYEMNLTYTEIVRYFQANVILEFMFYTAGAIGSNIFLVGVVSASAGVKLYPDMYVGGKLLSPEKILSLIRLSVLLLALSVSISWATVGAWNGIYWYITFRRFNYFLSISVVAFISLPVLSYFGSRMNKMIKKTVKVLEKPKTAYTVEASTADAVATNNSKSFN
ncbi:hypothetical protein HDV06_003547 [Boothiomyces sp. JEL0866]|nr:hypothetical protein HDV06_003547 [Boothiomyces sp. JEL0866]